MRKKQKSRLFICRILGITFSMCLIWACGEAPQKIDTIIEDGNEVILNHIEPYTLSGEPGAFSCRDEFVIDTEDDSIAGLGLTDIGLINQSYFDEFGVHAKMKNGFLYRVDEKESGFKRLVVSRVTWE